MNPQNRKMFHVKHFHKNSAELHRSALFFVTLVPSLAKRLSLFPDHLNDNHDDNKDGNIGDNRNFK